MADALSINLLGSLQVKTNNTLTDIVEIADRDVAGTLKFETTLTLAAGAVSSQVVLPSSIAGVGKYLCVSSDLDITTALNGTSHLIPARLLLLKMNAVGVITLYLSNGNSSDATVRVFLVG
jgi:hypothetical protein